MMKIRTVIKTDYAMAEDEKEMYNSLSSADKKKFIEMAKKDLMKLIHKKLEADHVEVTVLVFD
jgi:hypothetical protein